MSKDRPILFSTEMVKAILAGRKTMTRRVVKPQPWFNTDWLNGPEMYEPAITDRNGELQPGKPVYGIYDNTGEYGTKCPYQPGDILWVRETWGYYQPEYVEAPYFVYRADFPIIQDGIAWDEPKWRPSIHMPREVCRLFLKVTNVRVERLQDITEEDARAEGIREFDLMASNGTTKLYGVTAQQSEMAYNAKDEFQDLWNSINAGRGYSWESNPWVWVVEFEKVES